MLEIIKAGSFAEARTQVMAMKQQMESRKREDALAPFALIVDGPSLVWFMPPDDGELNELGPDKKKFWSPAALASQLDNENLFLDLVRNCAVVICCRVSPLQKAKVVTLIKRRENAVTLAIGDGANDVSMIKAAHVGIGISGLEGRQAVLASDFSIGQFRFLKRLLLVHGRWSYIRMAAFLRYFFYKNFAFTLCNFWFCFFSGYSAQTIFDAVYISLFNVVFTSLPILAVGLFEQDVSAEVSLQFPVLYQAGPLNKYFTRRLFCMSLLRGFAHSLIIFFCVYAGFQMGGAYSSGGVDQASLVSAGVILSLITTLVTNTQLATETQYFSWVNWVFLGYGPTMWVFLFGLLYAHDDWIVIFVSSFYAGFVRTLATGNCWFEVLLVLVLCILPVFALKYFSTRVYPTPTDICRELARRRGNADLVHPVKHENSHWSRFVAPLIVCFFFVTKTTLL